MEDYEVEGLRIKKFILAALVLLLAAAFVLCAGYFLDELFFKEKKTSNASFRLEESRSYNKAIRDLKRYFYREFSLKRITGAAKLAVEKARRKGVKDVKRLEDIGLKALIASLGDVHSSYLTPEEYRRLTEDIKGSFYGVGFVLRYDKKLKRPVVYNVLKGSPGEKAGVKRSDIIISVDGKDTKGVSLDVIVSMIRGRKGTVVILEMERPGREKHIIFRVKRGKIEIPDLDTKVLDGKYGYIQLLSFSTGISGKVRDRVREFQKKGVAGFILDLRNNPGGLLDEAVGVVSIFVDKGVVVSYRGKGEARKYEITRGGAETDLPLVVLVNGGSASSSEIVAGALKDIGRATVVGSRTYGKGSVQKLFALPNGGAAKLTVSLYYLPEGESINGKGVSPNVRVELKDDPEREDMLQLEKCKKVLEDLIRRSSNASLHIPTAA